MGNPKDKAMQVALTQRRHVLEVRKRRSGPSQRRLFAMAAAEPVAAVPATRAMRPAKKGSAGMLRRLLGFFKGGRSVGHGQR